MAKSMISERSPAGLQVVIKKGARGSTIIKPRIIHTYSPKVYKIEPEEFLDLVQKLTGRCDSELIEIDGSITSTSGFSSKSHDEISISSYLTSEADSAIVATPLSAQLLASLPSPRVVTLDFLPKLAATPSAFNQSRRDAGFSLSAAF